MESARAVATAFELVEPLWESNGPLILGLQPNIIGLQATNGSTGAKVAGWS